eukprot:3045789-Prymnesium_polylepis.3
MPRSGTYLASERKRGRRSGASSARARDLDKRGRHGHMGYIREQAAQRARDKRDPRTRGGAHSRARKGR